MTEKSKLRLRLGLILLVANAPVGYGGLAVCSFLAFKTESTYWLKIGLGAYVLSWVMFGAGIILAGHAGREFLKIKWRRRIVALHRLYSYKYRKQLRKLPKE